MNTSNAPAMTSADRPAADQAPDDDESSVANLPRRTRIDSPHVLAIADAAAESAGANQPGSAPSPQPMLLEIDEEPTEEMEPTDEMIAAVIGESPEIRREQLQLQVAQLAGHLRQRLRDVDRREAAVNARASQLESELRSSRLWLRERELSFQERETELRRQIEELQEQSPAGDQIRLNDTTDDAPAVDYESRLTNLAEREQEIMRRENELRERRFEVERLASAVRHGQQLWEQQRAQQEQDLVRSRHELNAELDARCQERETAIVSGEAMLVEHALELDRERAALLADRRAWEQQQTRERAALEDLRHSGESEFADRRTRLEARHEWIEQQRLGLEHVRHEALGLHRQSLEMRLLAEQLWSQICSRLSPAEVTQSLAQLRLKMSEQYRLEEEQLDAKKQELVTLGERLTEQHRELAQLRGGLREWAAARHAEIEQQAAALIERELVLDAKDESFHQSQQSWQSERRRYEQRIRELTGQCRALPAAA